MKLLTIGDYTINPDAIDYLQGDRVDFCTLYLRSGAKLSLEMSKEFAANLVFRHTNNQV